MTGVEVDEFDGQVLLLAGAKASVAPSRLPTLVARAGAHVRERRATYRRTCERVHDDEVREVFLAAPGHWRDVGEALSLTDREVDAVARAHAEQLLGLGRRAGRREEFASALEIREAVVVGRTGP
jgi:hypothetical protein